MWTNVRFVMDEIELHDCIRIAAITHYEIIQ